MSIWTAWLIEFNFKFVEKASDSESDTNPIVASVARFALRVVNLCKTVQYYYHPYRRDNGVFRISKFAQTREWSRSLIRVVRWHPNIFKLAVAACDDSIRIYTDEKATVVLLKVGQKGGWFLEILVNETHSLCRIFSKNASQAWHGVRLVTMNWLLDVKTGSWFGLLRMCGQANRSLVSWIWHSKCRLLLPIKFWKTIRFDFSRNHSPVISIEWDKTGNLLASASTNSSDILIWNPDLQTNEPLKRVGPPSSLLKFSPDGSRLFTSTVGTVFRVWNTQNWMPERWTVPNGTIQSAVWSPCGGYLLFVTTEEPILYSLQFIEQQLFASE